MSAVKRLQSLKLSDDAMVTLTYEEGTGMPDLINIVQ